MADGSSFTAMAWVFRPESKLGHPDDTIFGGDNKPRGGRHDVIHFVYKSNRFYMAFGWADSSVEETARCGYWDHVAFVYDAATKEQVIFVNYEEACMD